MSIAHTSQSVPEKLNVGDLIQLTTKLSKVLAKEVELLTGMQIGKIADLQAEKLFLTTALENQRKLMDKHPHLKDTIDVQEKVALAEVIKVFEDILAENHRRLMIAQAANHRIVTAVTRVLRESSGSIYDDRGKRGMMDGNSLSITLNQNA